MPIRMLNAQGYQIVVDLGVMALVGLFFALVGPFATIQETLPLRLVYWIGVIIVGDALSKVSYARGSGQADLKGGLTAPVSRTYYPALKDAGWV